MKTEFLFRTDHQPGSLVKFHAHRALEVVYYLQGTGVTHIRQQPHRFRPGVFSVTPAGEPHDELSQEHTRCLCLGLADSGLEPACGCWRDADGRLLAGLEALQAELQAPGPGGKDIVAGLLLQIRGLIRRAAGRPERENRKALLVERALDIIRETEGQLSVKDLSRELYVSREYLRHLFQEYAGDSPLRHILTVRLEKAKLQLAEPDATVAQVADNCGFASQHYFSRLFKQAVGVSPSAYRAAALNPAAS